MEFDFKNPGIVLDGWAAQYRSQRNQTVDYYAMTDIAECEYQFAEICSQRNMRYALTAFSGAARLAPSVRYQRMYAYVEGNPDSLADALGWKRVTSGANVVCYFLMMREYSLVVRKLRGFRLQLQFRSI